MLDLSFFFAFSAPHLCSAAAQCSRSMEKHESPVQRPQYGHFLPRLKESYMIKEKEIEILDMMQVQHYWWEKEIGEADV